MKTPQNSSLTIVYSDFRYFKTCDFSKLQKQPEASSLLHPLITKCFFLNMLKFHLRLNEVLESSCWDRRTYVYFLPNPLNLFPDSLSNFRIAAG